jgi:hypothetical protein
MSNQQERRVSMKVVEKSWQSITAETVNYGTMIHARISITAMIVEFVGLEKG